MIQIENVKMTKSPHDNLLKIEYGHSIEGKVSMLGINLGIEAIMRYYDIYRTYSKVSNSIQK